MRGVRFLINTLSGGGAERAVSNITLEMNEDINKELVLFGNSAKVDYPYQADLSYLDKKNDTDMLNKIKNLIYRVSKLRKIKKADTKSTISYLLYPNLINALTAKNGHTILSVRNHMSMQYKTGNMSKVWNYVIKHIYPKADLITVVSEEIKKDLIHNYKINKDKIKVIYNSYDIKNIQKLSQEPIDKEYRSIFNNPVIITVGRLDKQKGIQHLIRSFSQVYEKNPKVKLVIIGSGLLQEYLKDLVSDMQLDDAVYFLGYQENPFKYISKASLYVMPSIFEGFPNALSEAMACGVPVLASDCLSGPREILAPEEFERKDINYEISKKRFGVLMPTCSGQLHTSQKILTEDEKTMAELIATLINSPELLNYFSLKSLERIEDFNIKNVIKEWENIIGFSE